MNISHISIPFEKIEQLLGLPETARIVSAKEHENGRFVVVRVLADTLPQDFALAPGDPLTKIGDAYRVQEPEVVEGVVEGDEDMPSDGPVS